MDSAQRLISLGSSPLSSPISLDALRDFADEYPPHAAELRLLLGAKNGFYAFESALLVRPFHTRPGPPLGLQAWNDQTVWRETYPTIAPSTLFFAEDIFGGQFAITKRGVESFDAETGDLDLLCNTIAEWVSLVLDDYRVLTGYPLGADWQQKNRPLRAGERLVPRQLFVLGGEYECDNLRPVEEVKGMRSRRGYASKIAGLPGGTQIVFELVD